MRTAAWDMAELSFAGTASGNPYQDTVLTATFTNGDTALRVNGFYDGEGIHKLRFMPEREGVWRYTTASNDPSLDGLTGTVDCVPPQAGVHGPVRVNGMGFAHADGASHVSLGTTCYVWNHQPQALREKTLETLRHAPFNKMRMCVFPKSYQYNHNAPAHYPFVGSEADGFDFTRFNPAYWAELESCILALQALGIECDIILLHPYDRWGFARMDAQTDDFYLRYAVARLCAFRNVWWSMANEYDLMEAKTPADWRRMGELVTGADPYGHPCSIHNCFGFYDHAEPWITHCSIQSSRMLDIPQWRETYGKPVVIDEMCYEGNVPYHWGCISAKEMTRRFWEVIVMGAFPGHGETYLNDREVLWWSKGGELVGESPARIAFLRELLADMPGDAKPLNALHREARNLLGVEGAWYLHEATGFQPSCLRINLPEGDYAADVIDAWNMTVTPAGIVRGEAEIQLPSKTFMAVKLRRVQ